MSSFYMNHVRHITSGTIVYQNSKSRRVMFMKLNFKVQSCVKATKHILCQGSSYTKVCLSADDKHKNPSL